MAVISAVVMISVHMEMEPTQYPCYIIHIITSCEYAFLLYTPPVCDDFETHFYTSKSRHASDGVSRPAFPIKAFDFVGNDFSFQCDVLLFRHPELCLHFSAGNICNEFLFMIGDEMIDIYSMRLKNHLE